MTPPNNSHSSNSPNQQHQHARSPKQGPLMARIPRAVSVPPPARGRRWVPSLVWLVPLLVVLAGAAFAIRAASQRGPMVTIKFATAEGLEPHKTAIRYKGVAVGVIKSIDLLGDRSGVVVTADLSPQMAGMMVEDARFWVVRPRVSAAGVSGMGTLFTGAHVAFDAGVSPNARRAFVGLEAAPTTISDRRGRRFALRADNIGSLDVGSPLYLRRFQVGQVTGVSLGADGDAVLLDIFVDAPYDAHVRTNTRFWNASGVDVTVDTRGIKLDTQSLASVLVGGIAFETPGEGGDQRSGPAPSGTSFQIYPGRDVALRAPSSTANQYRLVFGRPARGLTPGSPVELLGLEIGEVLGVDVEFDQATAQPRTVVTLAVHPERIRLRSGAPSNPAHRSSADDDWRAVLGRLVERGLRGQVRSGNILTGQRYVAFELVGGPHTRPGAIDWSTSPPSLPAFADVADGLPEALTRLVAKLDKIPLDNLARESTLAVREMRQTFVQASSLIARFDGDLTPRLVGLMGQTQKTLSSVERTLASDAPIQRDLRGVLRDLSGAGQAMRSLAEYLERHPESLIHGKKGDVP